LTRRPGRSNSVRFSFCFVRERNEKKNTSITVPAVLRTCLERSYVRERAPSSLKELVSSIYIFFVTIKKRAPFIGIVYEDVFSPVALISVIMEAVRRYTMIYLSPRRQLLLRDPELWIVSGFAMNESRLITPPLVKPSRARRAILDEIGKLRAEREEPRGGGESFIICFLFF